MKTWGKNILSNGKMLKKRVIISLLLNDGELYRTKQFVPDYQYTMEFVTVDSIDELFIIDITRPGEGKRENFTRYVKRIVENCFVPITVGGHFRTIEDIKWALGEFGADCVLMGNVLYDNPFLISEIAEKFGSQLLTVACDYRKGEVYTKQGGLRRFVSAKTWAKAAEYWGAGQIFLQSIDRDGSLEGYDLETLKEVTEAVNIPVVIGGGCAGWWSMQEAFEAGADGCSTSNIYHFPENTMSAWKQSLQEAGVPVRVE